MLFFLFWLIFFARDIYASDHPYIKKFSSFSNDDWVEVCVPVGSQINISDYAIEDLAKNHKNGTDCIIDGGDCYVFDFGNYLNNAGDVIYLIYQNNSIDCVSYGDKSCVENTPSDFEKLDEGEYGIKTDDGWTITNDFSKSENICLYPTAIPSDTPTPSLTPSVTPVLSQNFDIIISEVYPNPSQGYEWVELYNNSGKEAVLTDWKIDDQDEGGSSPYPFSAIFGPDSYVVVEIQKSSMFNDSGDEVRLLNNQGRLIDSLSYEKIDKGISYSLVGDSYCFSLPTPETDNFDCFEGEKFEENASATPIPSPTLKPTEKTIDSPTPSLKPTHNKDQEASQSSEIYINDIVLSGSESGEVKGEKKENIKSSPDTNNRNAFITLIFIGLGTSILGVYYMLSKNEKNSFTNN